MKKYLFFLMLLSFPMVSQAATYVGGVAIERIWGGTSIVITPDKAPADTCSAYGARFSFDSTTPRGNTLRALLLAAYMGNKKIDIWYTPSSAPGKNETNGCDEGSIAIVHDIGFEQSH